MLFLWGVEKVNSVLDKYIFVHTMDDIKKHNLVSTSTCKNRNQLGDIENTTTQLTFDLYHHTFYAFKNFHEKPHGSALQQFKNETENKLKKSGVHLIHINTIDSPINKLHDSVKLAVPGSPQVLNLQLVGLDEENLLEIVLDKGESNATRDVEGVAKRLTVGFKQKQCGGSSKSIYQNGICLPWYSQFFEDDVRHLMGPKMIEHIGKILSLSQEYLDDFFAGSEDPPMSDPKRNSLFGDKFASSISGKCTSRFEYLDIFVESGSQLNRHMDYMNGCSKGYEYGTSYSYTHMYDGKLYRVNLIAVCRKVCDASMRELE